jgi:hypothetical protein
VFPTLTAAISARFSVAAAGLDSAARVGQRRPESTAIFCRLGGEMAWRWSSVARVLLALSSSAAACSDSEPHLESGSQAEPSQADASSAEPAAPGSNTAATPSRSDAGSDDSVDAGSDAASTSGMSQTPAGTDASITETKPPHRSPQPIDAPNAAGPENMGVLVGPGSPITDASRPYGSNLGSTFEHAGSLFMLLGDTWADASAVCTAPSTTEDDTIGRLPLSIADGVPQLELSADPAGGKGLKHIRLARDGAAVNLGYGQAPIAGFSDGTHAFAWFAQQTAADCSAAPQKCDQAIELGVASTDDLATYDSVLRWQTAKFSQAAVRTIAKFSERTSGSDYQPGHDTLLMWGRPSAVSEHGRQAPLYLMSHALPLARDSSGQLTFAPRYFAGVDETTGEPKWTEAEPEARPIALDGQESGDPYEVVQITGQMSIAWLPSPIDKWVMLYGGDVAESALLDPASTRSKHAPGAIMLRFANHPWGPFTPPLPHLVPGFPTQTGAAAGPGGFLYSPECRDAGDQRCAAPNPARAPSCSELEAAPARGWLSGPNIIAPYLRPNAEGGIDLFWNVSTWNPYGIQLLRTKLTPGPAPVTPNELADDRGLQRLRNWNELPTLGEKSRYRQQSSHDRGLEGDVFQLSRAGNRDYNNFICASRDATVSSLQVSPIKLDQTSCEEPYVRGLVMARFVGAGRHVRSWVAMTSLTDGSGGDQVLRMYVDDEPVPRVEGPLSQLLDGRAAEIFAPPFGAGSSKRLSWYYPVAFKQKLIVSLDQLRDDDHFYHCDVMLDDARQDTAVVPAYPSRRAAAAEKLSSVFHPSGTTLPLRNGEALKLAPGETRSLQLQGPATIAEFRVQLPDSQYTRLDDIHLRVHWDSTAEAAIDVTLAELLGNGRVPPPHSTQALTSFVENGARVLALKLPMPFADTADLTLENTGTSEVEIELSLSGLPDVPPHPFGRLHVQRRETVGPTQAQHHVAAEASGLGRLVGVCAFLQARPDPDSGIASAPLNALEGDVNAQIDGAAALVGTGTEEYADDIYYFAEAPQSTPFEQAWGVVSERNSPGLANFCRWHVLGTELDFSESLQLTFELGGSQNPGIVDRLRTIAFLYQ